MVRFCRLFHAPDESLFRGAAQVYFSRLPRMKTRDILNVTALGITRDGTTILDRVTWTVRAGEHWVILGANGSGKTSLLSALSGYLTPTTGEVEVLGERYGSSDWRELRRAIGIVSSAIRQMMHDD